MLIYWIYLLIAILFEVSGTTCMKVSAGFTKITPSILMVVFYGICFLFLTLSLKKIELSVAYAIWSGLGTVLIASIGIFWFRESISPIKLTSLALIVIGVIGLKSTK
jgi:small multidrug resistance pump